MVKFLRNAAFVALSLVAVVSAQLPNDLVDLAIEEDSLLSASSWDEATITPADGEWVDGAFGFTYTIPAQSGSAYPGAAYYIAVPNNETDTLTGATDFYVTYKSSHDIQLELATDLGDPAATDPFLSSVYPASAEFTPITVPIGEFKDADWGAPGVLNLAILTGFAIGVVSNDLAIDGSVYIKEVGVAGCAWSTGADPIINVTSSVNAKFNLSAVGNSLVLKTPAAGKYVINVFTANGRAVRSVMGAYDKGINNVNIGKLSAGNYVARVTSNGVAATFPITIGASN